MDNKNEPSATQAAQVLLLPGSSGIPSTSQATPSYQNAHHLIPTNPKERRAYHRQQAEAIYGVGPPEITGALLIMAAVHHHDRPAPSAEMLEDLDLDGPALSTAAGVAGEAVVLRADFFTQGKNVAILPNGPAIADQARAMATHYQADVGRVTANWPQMAPFVARQKFASLMKDLEVTSVWVSALVNTTKARGLYY